MLRFPTKDQDGEDPSFAKGNIGIKPVTDHRHLSWGKTGLFKIASMIGLCGLPTIRSGFRPVELATISMIAPTSAGMNPVSVGQLISGWVAI